MKIYKRYSNRKLYDTEERSYISLDDITGVIQSGEEFQVLDHDTGADLTTLVLLQVMLEQEKRISGFLPQTILRKIAQAGRGPLENLRSSAASFLTPLINHDTEIQRRIHSLVSGNLISAVEARQWQHLLIDHFIEDISNDDLSAKIAPESQPPMEEIPPTEIQMLAKRIQELENKLDDLLTKKGRPDK